MPHVIVKMYPGRSEHQKAQLAEAIAPDTIRSNRLMNRLRPAKPSFPRKRESRHSTGYGSRLSAALPGSPLRSTTFTHLSGSSATSLPPCGEGLGMGVSAPGFAA